MVWPSKGCPLLCILLLALGLGSQPLRASVEDIWPRSLEGWDHDRMARQAALVVNAEVPSRLRPTLAYQALYLRIMAGEPIDSWEDEVRQMAAQSGEGVVGTQIQELARVWEARLRMRGVERHLRDYYRRQVRFPAALSELDLPAELRTDPWGEPWAYQPARPATLPNLEGQRFHLAPSRYPDLTPLNLALSTPPEAAAGWRINRQTVAGRAALQITTPETTALIEPGGRVGEATLLYATDTWALFAGRDRLFGVTF